MAQINEFALSICIPTYNRGSCLSGLLGCIFRQLAGLSLATQVEIVIVDGGSTDNTGEIVRHYSTDSVSVKYYRRDKRQGIDADILRCVELANGKYCWLFSDDDRMCAGAIEYLVSKLDEVEQVSGCFLNRVPYDSTMRFRVAEINGWPHEILKSDYLFLNKESCFSVLGMDLGFISCQVVRRDLWRDAVERNDLSPYYNNYLMLYVLGLMMNTACRWLYLDRPLVIQRTGNDSFLARDGYLKRQKMEHESLAKVIGAHYPKESRTYRKVFGKMVGRLPRVVGNMKALGVEYRCQRLLLTAYIKRYGAYLSFWTVAAPLFLLPNGVFRITKCLYFKYLEIFSSSAQTAASDIGSE
jgi:abequosyltransferase